MASIFSSSKISRLFKGKNRFTMKSSSIHSKGFSHILIRAPSGLLVVGIILVPTVTTSSHEKNILTFSRIKWMTYLILYIIYNSEGTLNKSIFLHQDKVVEFTISSWAHCFLDYAQHTSQFLNVSISV